MPEVDPTQQDSSMLDLIQKDRGELLNESTKEVYGIPYRQDLFAGEHEYFQQNPHVAGMAAEDNQIILNPYSTLSDAEKKAVMLNEAARIYMRQGKIPPPQFELSSEQSKNFGNYSQDINDIRQTIVGRILSGDPSSGAPTPDQMMYVQRLRQLMGVK